jgi:hypothetical protein
MLSLLFPTNLVDNSPMQSGSKKNISGSELVVLKCLAGSSPANRDRRITEISEISFNTGIRDNDEVLRALYTLEGKSLVQPEPRGDFTSHQWQITDVGMRALEFMRN